MKVPAIFLTLLIVAAGCVTTGSNLLSAADTLDNRTQRFYEELRRYRADDRTVRDAEELADAADDFHRAIERRESSDELDFAFDRVAERYHQLREYYDDRGRDRVESERFEAITTAYLEVEGALKYRGSRQG